MSNDTDAREVERDESDKSAFPDLEDIDWGPKKESLEDGEPCPECGYPMGDDWENVYYSGKGIQFGEETWQYECPSCNQVTCEVGT